MDSKTRLKEYINQNFPNWKKVEFAEFDDNINFKEDFSDLYKLILCPPSSTLKSPTATSSFASLVPTTNKG